MEEGGGMGMAGVTKHSAGRHLAAIEEAQHLPVLHRRSSLCMAIFSECAANMDEYYLARRRLCFGKRRELQRPKSI